jgi:hypothetical protein
MEARLLYELGGFSAMIRSDTMTNANETKRQPIITTETTEGGILLIHFPTLDKDLELNAADLHPSILEAATLHGLKQKLVDAAAISRNPETGKSATAQDKYAAVKEVYDRITDPTNPTWNAIREGVSGSTLLLLALIRHTGKDKAELTEWLGKKSDAEKAALKRNPKLAAIIAEIQAERAKADGIDTNELLGEIE